MQARPHIVSTQVSSIPPRIATRARWLGALFALVAAGGVQAQTCAAPVVAPGPPGWQFEGDTLYGDTSFTGFCGGAVAASGPVWVYRLRPWTTSTEIRVVEHTGPWHPVMFLVDASEPCGAETQCLAAGDAFIPLQLPAPPFVDYWLYVTSSEFDSTGSGGPFLLTMNGTPDDADLIFADGFD